jgi:two-component system OmpR family sensor kinase
VRRISLRARLVLGVLVLAGIALLSADVATYTSLRSFLFDRTDSSLEADHHLVESALGRNAPHSPGDFQALLTTAPGLYIELRSPSGKVVYTGGVPRFPGTAPQPPPRLPAHISLPPARAGGAGQGPQPDRVHYLTVGSKSGSGRYRVRASLDPGSRDMLIVATPLGDVDGTLHRLFLIELLVTGIVLAAIVLIGLWIVRLGLRPLAAIGKTAEQIAGGDLSHRVERAEPRTEVGRLGLALNAMLGRIEDSDRRLRRFVADASHELRTPLAAVRAYAELFERGASQRPADLERAMSGIGRESERMSALVDDLLLLARLDEGRPLERERLELDELAAEAVETARTLDPERPIEFSAERVAVLGDRVRLRQVLDNLLGNARLHTPPRTPVHVHVTAAEGSALVDVADEGPGMTAEQAEHVFERFYRADPTRARETGGVGLGLAIVAAVTEAHGGSVTVDSQPERGTTFRVALPRLT